MSWIVHDSQDSFYRYPFGAVPCGTKVLLRLKVYCQDEIEGAFLHCRRNEGDIDLTMRAAEQQSDGGRVFEADLSAPAVPGLLWYYFYLVIHGRVYYYGNNHQQLGGLGTIKEEIPPSYQITVYQGDFTVPAWFSKSVMYQIFVDRFCNGNKDGHVLNPKKGSLIHGTWDDTPLYVREPETHAIRRWTFFGGNLEGIVQKLPYLKELGISVIYLNPIFEASSNHKYDTGDYLKIDPMYGNNETFRHLCEEAKKQGIGIILDGVFSHTGSDSVYFNREGSYNSVGAYQSKNSPYYKWYRFTDHPHAYESWWGIGTLPNVDELEPSYKEFIIDGKDSVVRYWMRMGTKGWRLDVADELPDEFIKDLRKTMKEMDPESVLIGEVWEDASNKVSYGQNRAFLWGEELDSVMNYPFRRAVLDFMLQRKDAREMHQQLMSLYENYPREAFYSAMNLVGSHDVARILTLLGEGRPGEHINESQKEKERLSPAQRELGIKRLKLLVLLQMTFPGVPCIYYGDEAGLEGYADPYNRGPYPWGKEDQDLLSWYKKTIALRNASPALQDGDWRMLVACEDVYGYLRFKDQEEVAVFLNRHPVKEQTISVSLRAGSWKVLWGEGGELTINEAAVMLHLQPLSGLVLQKG